MKTNIYKNLEVQYTKLFRHLKVGSFKTRERYGKAFKRFMVFLAREYRLQKLCNISEKHILAYVSYMQKKGLSASTIKTELAAIRFFHDNMPYTRNELPTNEDLDLKKRTFGGVDRTWTTQEFNHMLIAVIDNKDYQAILCLARYAGLRLEECFRIDTNDAKNALETGELLVKGKGGLWRYVPINESIRITFRDMLKITPIGEKLFVRPYDKTHLAMKRLQCFIAYHRKAFTENTLIVRHTVHSTEEGIVAKDRLKTKSSYRTLTLEPFVRGELLKHREKQEQMKKVMRSAYSKEYTDYVCVDALGKLYDPDFVTGHFGQLLKKHNLKKIRFHDLRHSCASVLLAQGVPMKQIQEWLGHSDMSTTANIYSHLDAVTKADTGAAMSKALG